MEELRDLAFNAPDLEGPAEAIGSEVRISEPFSLEEGEGLFADERLRELAFSADVKESSNNSEVLELAGKQFIAVRVREVRAPQVAPFAEVEREVRQGLRAELEASALTDMVTRAEDLLAAGETFEVAAEALNVEWRVELAATRLSSQLPRPVLEAAFTMPQGKPSRLQTVAVPGEGYALVQLARVTPGDTRALTSAEKLQLSDLRSGEQQRLSFDEFVVHQRNAADVVIR